MRESKIEAYKPGYKSPWYPFVQIAGMIISLWLVAEMGLLAVGLTGTLIVLCIGWYFYYAHGKVKRQGAIYHVHARLGQLRYEALEHELMTIINEKNLKSSLTYEEVIARSIVMRAKEGSSSFDRLIMRATIRLDRRLKLEKDVLRDNLADLEKNFTQLKKGVFFKYVQMEDIKIPEMVAIQAKEGIELTIGKEKHTAHAMIFLITPADRPLLHMRIIGHLAELIEAEEFLDRWKVADNEQELKSVLLSDERLLHLRLQEHIPSEKWIGKAIKDLTLPGECLVTIIERDSEIIIPKGKTRLESGDVLTVLGYPDDINQLRSDLE
mgnify:FL=1